MDTDLLDAVAKSDWVSASSLRNHMLGDPLLDWLARHGEEKGYAKDPANGLDFGTFIMAQGHRFEAGVLDVLRRRGLTLVEAEPPHDGPRGMKSAVAARTFGLMREGAPLILQGLLAHPQSGTYGYPDLLVRSDLLDELVPGTLGAGAAHLPAPGLGTPFHYVVVDVKFTTLAFGKGWELESGGSGPAYAAQVLVYNRALAWMQGYTPAHAYLLGRSWSRRFRERGEAVTERGGGCLERLGPIAGGGEGLWERIDEAVGWRRRLRAEGAGWVAEPVPSRVELRPDLGNTSDSPWHGAKARLAAATGELTQLWHVGRRAAAAGHNRGITRADDPALQASALGLTGVTGARLDALLAVERDPAAVVVPARIGWNEGVWRTPAPVEFFVDFETVSDLNDDFTQLPARGGTPMIFQIGCLHVEGGTPVFRQFTADRLDLSEEARVVAAWSAWMAGVRDRLAPGARPRVWHWSPAETSMLLTAMTSYRAHFPAGPVPDVEFRDALAELVKPSEQLGGGACVAVKGAGGFGLKAVAKALHAHGRVATAWGDGPADGLGAMVGAWQCDQVAREGGSPMPAQPLMQQIGAYNETDCRAMYEVIDYLRRRH